MADTTSIDRVIDSNFDPAVAVEMIEDPDVLAPVRMLTVELVVRESCGAPQTRSVAHTRGKKEVA